MNRLGAIAQLEERYRGTVEVVGSSPTSSTELVGVRTGFISGPAISSRCSVRRSTVLKIA